MPSNGNESKPFRPIHPGAGALPPEQNPWDSLAYPGERNIDDSTGQVRTDSIEDLYPYGMEVKDEETGEMRLETPDEYRQRLDHMREATDQYLANRAAIVDDKGKRTEHYLKSDQGKQELQIESELDALSAKLDRAVADGNFTQEHADSFYRNRFNKALEKIEGIRKDYEDRQSVGTPEERARYDEWLESRDEENRRNLERTGRLTLDQVAPAEQTEAQPEVSSDETPEAHAEESSSDDNENTQNTTQEQDSQTTSTEQAVAQPEVAPAEQTAAQPEVSSERDRTLLRGIQEILSTAFNRISRLIEEHTRIAREELVQGFDYWLQPQPESETEQTAAQPEVSSDETPEAHAEESSSDDNENPPQPEQQDSSQSEAGRTIVVDRETFQRMERERDEIRAAIPEIPEKGIKFLLDNRPSTPERKAEVDAWIHELETMKDGKGHDIIYEISNYLREHPDNHSVLREVIH